MLPSGTTPRYYQKVATLPLTWGFIMREDAVTRILREAEGLSQAEIEALFKALSARRKATTRRPKQPGAERPVRPEPHQQRQPFEFTTKVTWM